MLTAPGDITEQKRAEQFLHIQRDLAMALGTATRLPDALNQVLDAAMKMEGIDCGGVYVVDEGTGQLHLAAHRNLSDEFVRAIGELGPHTPQARVVSRGQPLYLYPLQLSYDGRHLVREGLRIVAALPMQHEGRVVAVLNLGSRSREELPAQTREALETMAAQLGGVIARIRAEQARRRSEAQYRSLFECSNDAVLVHDHQGRILDVNARACEMLGHPRARLLAMRIFDCCPPEHVAEVHRALEYVSTTGQVRAECVLRRADGALLEVEISAAAARMGMDLVQTIVRDITARKRGEERRCQHLAELAHVSRLASMGELAAGIAHELNQPLAAIANFAGACTARLHAGVGDVQALLADLQDIGEQACRAGEIIRRLRSLIRKHEGQRSVAEVHDIIQEVLALLNVELREASVDPRLELAENLPRVLVDVLQVEQVLVNLVRNALEAMESVPAGKRTLTITAALASPDAVEIAVRDAGCGLAPDTLRRIGEPFFTTKPNGLGMGLSISRSIIEAHGGRLWAEANPGGGATFRITVPVVGVS